MSTHLDPFKVFQVYHGVFLHFTTDYDYQKYHGQTSYKQETFEKRKDKYSYHKLARSMEYYDYRYLEYYIAWLFFSEDKWVNTKIIEDRTTNFEVEWRNYSNYRQPNFEGDMKKITDVSGRLVFDLWRTGEIHAQSILILDQFYPVIALMQGELRGQYLWDLQYKKLKKFRPFYVDHEPIQEIHFKQYIPETIRKCQEENL